jgi:hypothetical protein
MDDRLHSGQQFGKLLQPSYVAVYHVTLRVRNKTLDGILPETESVKDPHFMPLFEEERHEATPQISRASCNDYSHLKTPDQAYKVPEYTNLPMLHGKTLPKSKTLLPLPRERIKVRVAS